MRRALIDRDERQVLFLGRSQYSDVLLANTRDIGFKWCDNPMRRLLVDQEERENLFSAQSQSSDVLSVGIRDVGFK
jgi:hypothetical protein